MQDTELKIGNIVFLKSRNKIYTIQSGYDIDTGCDSNDFEPVTLTEEWRLKFGFEESVYAKGVFIKNDFAITLTENGFIVNHIYNSREYKYVHQLQNLYFDLTGEELFEISVNKNKKMKTKQRLEKLEQELTEIKKHLKLNIDTSDFMLPEKWCIKINTENVSIINNWNNERAKSTWYIHSPDGWLYSDNMLPSPNRVKGYTEITTEQFKKYVLGEESKSKQVEQIEKFEAEKEENIVSFEIIKDFPFFKKGKIVTVDEEGIVRSPEDFELAYWVAQCLDYPEFFKPLYK